MWAFLKRQFKTKTGKAGITSIIGTVVGMAVGAVTVATGAPIVAIGVAAILLRDGEAKKQQDDGE